MAWTERDLEVRARREYETSRFVRALRPAAFVAPLAAISIATCALPSLTLPIAALLAVLVVFLGWRGRAAGRAVIPGMLAGLPAFALPLLSRATGHMCLDGQCVLLPTACIVGGILGGAILTIRQLTEGEDRRGSIPAGAAVAVLTGALGCVLVGFGGVLGMSAAVAFSAAPALALSRLQRAS